MISTVGLVLAAIFTEAFFRSTAICDGCGAQRISRSVFWIPVPEVRATKVSAYLDSIGYPGSHEHKWLFSQGSGGTVMCAIGPGRHLARFVDEQCVVDFLIGLRSYRGEAAFNSYLRQILTPRSGMRLEIPYDFTTEDRRSREAFNAWMENRGEGEVFVSPATVEPPEGSDHGVAPGSGPMDSAAP